MGRSREQGVYPCLLLSISSHLAVSSFLLGSVSIEENAFEGKLEEEKKRKGNFFGESHFFLLF